VQVEFSPTAAGYQTGVLTFTDSTSKTYTVTLAGYSPAVATASYLDPTTLAFPGQVLTTILQHADGVLEQQQRCADDRRHADGDEYDRWGDDDRSLLDQRNAGRQRWLQRADGGAEEQVLGGCGFCAHRGRGDDRKRRVFPVTYANNATTSFTLSLSGTGVAVKDASELSPTSLTFQDQAVAASVGNGTDATQNVNFWNTGNLPLTLGPLTGTDTVIGTTTVGDFTTNGTYGGYDGCSNQTVSPLTRTAR
jgi:hypothetical protein